MIDGDKLNYTLSRTEGENIGEYAISVTLGENPNYNVTVTGNKLTITPKTVTVTVTFKANYEGSTADDVTQAVAYNKETALKAFKDTSVTPNVNMFTRSGYQFNGWNTVAEPTGDNPGTAYDDEADEIVAVSTAHNDSVSDAAEGVDYRV